MRGAACVLSALLLLAGCAGRQLPSAERPNDPLLPGPALPEKGTTISTDGDSAAPKEPLPPAPPGDKKASPASLTAPGGATKTPSAGVTLGAPRATAPKPAAKPAAITPTGFAPAGPATFESVQAHLRSRGVEWQQLTHLSGASWRFVCAVPNLDNPGLRDNFEVTREGGNGLAAMQAVLAEIDERRRK